MPSVLGGSMQESSWEDGRVVLSARGSGSGGHSVTPGAPGGQGGSATAAAASRTQDDARVGYFFQRPQAGGAHQPYDPALLKAWAANDGESSSFQGQDRTVSDLEKEFHRLSVKNAEEGVHKMWTPGQKPGGAGGVDSRGQEGSGGIKMMFPPSVPNGPWLSRDDS